MKVFRVAAALSLAVFAAGHIGSPDVIFSGMIGTNPITVVVQPPEVVPGVARVTVRVPSYIRRVTIRPVFWRAGTKGAPSADEMRRVATTATTFGKVLTDKPVDAWEGSVWLMSRGAYSVEVTAYQQDKPSSIVVPVPAIATGRLALDTPLAAALVVLGLFLVAGLVNIVRKGAGEGLLDAGKQLNEAGVKRTRIAGGVALAVLCLAAFGGARWWDAVDGDYKRNIYKPSPLAVSLTDGTLHVAAGDTLYMPGPRPSGYVPDHGKLMHLFLVGEKGMAHLHPRPDSGAIPAFTATLPPLPSGTYRVYGDVVQETGFERTMVGSVQVGLDLRTALPKPDVDDGWYVGDATAMSSTHLRDGTAVSLEMGTPKPLTGELLSLQVSFADSLGRPALVDQYLGMAAHAVVVRDSGDVFVHLHPSGTSTVAAVDVFAARDRGDTTNNGRLKPFAHDMASMQAFAPVSRVTFPYAFPKAGAYRVFVQVKRGGRVLTGAFLVNVDAAPAIK